MSRLRDLRELICVSRLTYRESDDEVSDDALSDVCTSFDRMTSHDQQVTSFGKVSDQPVTESADSGIAIGTNNPDERTSSSTMENSDSDAQIPKRKRKKKRVKKSSTMTTTDNSSQVPNTDSDRNYDNMLCYIDSSIVGEWLIRANEWVNDLSVWCHTGTNYIDVASFILTEFQDLQRQKIMELEYSIFMDELVMAFSAGLHAGKISRNMLQHLALAVFREYPTKLISEKGKILFLDYLDILSSEKRDSYRKLLSDVKISTQNRQYAQLLLAVRAFALASIWFAVVNFYRKLKSANLPHNMEMVSNAPSTADLEIIVRQDQSVMRLIQAIKCDQVPVLDYFIKTGKVSYQYRDDHGRSLLHIAIMNNRERVLDYLLSQTECVKEVNHCAHNGNSPLHAAINNGNQYMVRLLIRKAQADCNVRNPFCDNATPLHVAVMHGYQTIVVLLLDAGADPELKMGDLDAMGMAEEFGREEIKLELARRMATDSEG